MKFLRSEAGASVVWMVGCLALAATLSPWLYAGGRELAAAAGAKELSAPLEWLGAACGRAKFGRYFSRALAISAVVLLPFLFRRLRTIRNQEGVPRTLREGVPLRRGLLQLLLGVVIAASTLWAAGAFLYEAGVYTARLKPLGADKILTAVLLPAVVAGALEEWLFRGLLLGLWLRFARPALAVVGLSLFFAFIHFLEPPPGSAIANPAAPLAGFELLGKILGHFADPVFFVTDFATLFVIGLILAWARLRTGALWFSIGLHAGWIMAFKGFNLMHRSVDSSPWHPWGVGDSLRSGLIPMATLAVTAAICHFAFRHRLLANAAFSPASR